ncbi:MAG: ResB protein required for cytochrome C biosynthesis [Verrucomicrobia bacterium]|nr:ResB protein required for cytochrome C biosynthesis [Verrucomicrobiota bacterium]
MLRRLLNFFSSLWLTVVLLALALVLVFIGTLAQVKLGLYVAQEEYFRSFFVWWQPAGTNFKLPVFPAGWLLGTLLLVNLLVAHIKRFKLSWKKSGILLIHSGLIFLLVGQFLTEVYQVESVMRISEGGSKNFSEDSRKNELAIIDVTEAASNKVISIPESFLRQGEEIRHPELPFAIRVKTYFENSTPTGKMDDTPGKISSTHGIGKRLQFAPMKITATMDDDNKPTALVEIVGGNETTGEWIVSTWLNRYPWFESLNAQMGSLLEGELEKPQSFTYAGRNYEIALRAIRYYKPYTVTLLEATHDKYQGTEIPKNFSSQVRIDNPKKGEQREVLIYMNNPLRYEGETYFQFQMNAEPGMKSSAFQVVRNPAAITPYVSCTLVGVGMIVQFLMHLVAFGRRRNKATPTRVVSEPNPVDVGGAR